MVAQGDVELRPRPLSRPPTRSRASYPTSPRATRIKLACSTSGALHRQRRRMPPARQADTPFLLRWRGTRLELSVCSTANGPPCRRITTHHPSRQPRLRQGPRRLRDLGRRGMLVLGRSRRCQGARARIYAEVIGLRRPSYGGDMWRLWRGRGALHEARDRGFPGADVATRRSTHQLHGTSTPAGDIPISMHPRRLRENCPSSQPLRSSTSRWPATARAHRAHEGSIRSDSDGKIRSPHRPTSELDPGAEDIPFRSSVSTSRYCRPYVRTASASAAPTPCCCFSRYDH